MTYLLAGGSGALVTIQEGEFTPIPFAEFLDPSGGVGGGLLMSRPRVIWWRGSIWCGSAPGISLTRHGPPRSPGPPV
jgi:hypothetical protein